MSEDPATIAVTILVDNKADAGLLSEHGFSTWLEHGSRRLLFDTGQGAALEHNVQALGIDLRLADAVVLSHGHYDHSGGLPLVVARAPTTEIYAHPAATHPRYAIRAGVVRDIAMPVAARSALESHPPAVHWTTAATKLNGDVGITGAIPRQTDYEDTGGPFFLDAEGTEPDPILDDLALWLRTDRGLLVIVGCSHAGLINTLRYALAQSGERKLHAVLGGFHLAEANEIRLAQTMAALCELDPDLIVPCHCTGRKAVEQLMQTFGERVVKGAAGAVFRFGIAAPR